MDRGYGSVKCGDRGALLVHRVAWELVRGPIPDGLDVLHSCDVRLCAKPDHLFLGTHLDNMRDMISKGRDVHFSGEQNGNSKLSIEDVDDIRLDDLECQQETFHTSKLGEFGHECRSCARHWMEAIEG